MSNFEKIKSMNIDEFAKWLDKVRDKYDETPWSDWFDENYCQKCEPVIAYAEYVDRELNFAWCELNDRCKHFDSMVDSVRIIKLWLESDC